MNRILKFRVWDDNNKCWLNSTSKIEFSLDPDTSTFEIADYSWKKQQFTGLTDKNGKEIYEGDIVNCTMDENSFDISRVNIEVKIEGLKLNIDGYYGSGIDEYTSYDDFEIIGNIFENPELIPKE